MKKKPTLVTLMGEDQLDLSFMDEADFNMLMGAAGKSDESLLFGADEVEQYLDSKYPELMGFWGKIVKVLGKVGKGVASRIRSGKGKKAGGFFKRIGSRIRARRARRRGDGGAAKRMAALNVQLAQAQKAKMVRDTKAKKTQQNKMVLGLAAVAAAAAALL